MNEEMNNNMVPNNNPINNNYYEPQKNNRGVKALLVVLIILVLCLIGLTCYKMFVYDKKDNKNNKDNTPVEEKENNKEENTPAEEKENGTSSISKELENKIKDNFMNAPYVEILNSNKDISKEMVLYYTITTIGSCNPMECYGEYKNQNSEYYKLYDKNYDMLNEKYSTKFDGQTLKAIYNSEIINKSARELYGKTITFANEEIVKVSKMYPTNVIYVKSNDLFAVYGGGGGMISDGTFSVKTIVNTGFKNNIYTIRFVETLYRAYIDENNSTDTYCYIIDKNNQKTKIECYDDDKNKINDYSLSHKDELPQYEVSFKIDGNSYEFIDIKKVN